MTRRIATLAAVIVVAPLAAQQPNDQGRVPVTQTPNSTGSPSDDNRTPVLQGAGAGTVGGIQSFPDTPAVSGLQQQYIPPRPQLSPYLNLFRGSSGAGLSAIDYFNFVRPAQQSIGSYAGRQYGSAPTFGGGGRLGFNVDPETGLATSARPTGAPGVFLNYGSYFNRLGTIGPGAAVPTAQPTTTGRR